MVSCGCAVGDVLSGVVVMVGVGFVVVVVAAGGGVVMLEVLVLMSAILLLVVSGVSVLLCTVLFLVVLLEWWYVQYESSLPLYTTFRSRCGSNTGGVFPLLWERTAPRQHPLESAASTSIYADVCSDLMPSSFLVSRLLE